MESSRRALLLGGVAGAAAVSMGQVSSCSSTATNVVPGVIDAITKIVQQTCGVIPVVTTLVDVVVKFFPAAAGVATVSEAVIKQIADFLCGLFKSAGFEAGKLPGKTLSATKDGTAVELHGWVVVDGKLTLV